MKEGIPKALVSWSSVSRKMSLQAVLLLLPSVFKASGENAVPALASDIGSPVLTAGAVSGTFLILLGALLVITFVILFFSGKLRIANRELRNRNRQIEEINSNLERSNRELAHQKDAITKEYSDSEKFYSMLIQSADDGISFYDRDWNLKFANPAFFSLIGLDQKEYFSIDTHNLIHEDDRDYSKKRMEALTGGGFFESELRLKHKDGHFLTLLTRSVSVKNDNNEVIGSLTISRDITGFKQVHEDLIKATRDAEASSRLKSSFLANISHEIRTPLNSVVGFSNLLLSNDITNEVREEYIEHINHNSEKLLQIIGDIIDLSRLESSQIEITYEETSVNNIVGEIIEEARNMIKRNEKSIILNVRNQLEVTDDLVFTDRVWLKRVLNHLMDNAVKFTLEGYIELAYSRQDQNLLFSVRDTGIGINRENLDRIFEEFRQEIDGHHRPFEGLGVGLTLAKEVIERMGGKIYVESEKGVGSEFSFSIPYRPAGGASRIKTRTVVSTGTPAPLNWSTKKCLLVDDNKDVLVYLNRVLIDTGIKILTARSGVEALEIVKSVLDLDVILLDMQMPGMNGIDATKEIRKLHKNLPIIAQTAFIFEDDKDIILEAGCDACLIKPIRKDHLLTVMSSFIKPD